MGFPMKLLASWSTSSTVARKARSADYVLAMPVEKSGQAEFDFEYGAEFACHIDEFDPALAKVLVRYNPDGGQEFKSSGIASRLGCSKSVCAF